MDDSQINTIMFETLEQIAPIGTARVSMFSITDRYSYIPFFRFRFKSINEDNKIYHQIKLAIEHFNGNVKWELFKNPDVRNYLIIPIILCKDDIRWSDTEKLKLYLGDSFYKKIDECIDDIPRLASQIKRECLRKSIIMNR